MAHHCWRIPAPTPDATRTTLRLANDLEQELAACADWCRVHLQHDSEARLLVLSACLEPSLAIQAELLWRSLVAGRARR